MNTMTLCIFSLLLIIGGSRGVPCKTSEYFLSGSEDQIISSDCTFQTKRVWVICSDSRYAVAGSSLFIQTKDTIFSDMQEPCLMKTSKTWKGGIFYYYDILKTVECFRVDSINDAGVTVYHTDWVCDIKPSFVYEVTSSVSANIRSRTTDVEDARHPDARILGLLLSSYITYDSSYENGFGGYHELNAAWFSKYIGNYGSIEGPDLSETYVYDYTIEEYENRYTDGRKTRIISVSEKINELSNAYDSSKSSDKLTSTRDKLVSIFVLCVCALISGALIAIAIVFDNKHDNQVGK